jgi:threonine dehydrogenase-like Zn-dependent dehydrogenase
MLDLARRSGHHEPYNDVVRIRCNELVAMSMLALRTSKSDGPKLQEIAIPKRKAGEALVRMRMAGICNTDLEIARGYMSFDGTLGHELVGEIVEADEPSAIGRRVVGEINLACHACSLCKRGLLRHCSARSVLGILNKDGCFANYVTLPMENLHRVPQNLSDEAAIFVEPIAACYEILEQVFAAPDDRIAVLGDGKLGQLVAAVLHAQGLDVVLVGKHEGKLARARNKDLRTAVAGELEARSYDLVVEATGSPSGMETALGLLRPRGTLVLKSTYHGKLSLDAAPIVIDEITLVGSRCGPFLPAVAALSSHAVTPEYLIDAVYPLQDAEAAFARAAEHGVLKVLLDMR